MKEQVEKCIRKSWSYETCSPGLKEQWSEDNPSLGQCAVTALLVNDIYGGKIMRCMASTGSHYYNLIDDKIVDLTVEQFQGEIPQYENGEERTRKYLLSNSDTKNRYLALLSDFSYEYSRVIQELKPKTKKEDLVRVMVGSGEHSFFTMVPKGTKVMVGSGEHSFFTRAGITAEEQKRELDEKIDALSDSKPVTYFKRIQRKKRNK